MSFTPSAAAQNTAALAASNMASLAAPLAAMQTAIAGGLLAPAAYIDAILSSCGLQLWSPNALGNNNNGGSASFADVPSTSIIFTAPLAKTYVVHCDFTFYFTVAGTGTDALVRLVVNGTTGPAIAVGNFGINLHVPVHLMLAAPCVVGSNTIKLQWASAGTTTLNTGVNDWANYAVSG